MVTMDIGVLTDNLNNDSLSKRLNALSELVMLERKGVLDSVARLDDVNNHIHTWYSFSPYSPTKAVWMAHRAGLASAGIVDHDSISGAAEFHEAAKIVNMKVTSGVELRVSFKNTPFAGRRINNPDQAGNAYIVLHAVPECMRGELKFFLEQISGARDGRNLAMVKRLNEITEKIGITIDYINDVLPISRAKEGGSVTERHILFALSNKLVEKFGRGEALLKVLTEKLGLDISEKNRTWLSDIENEFYAYDLLGALKSSLVPSFYIPAGSNECPDIETVLGFATEIGAVSAYAYLGGVTLSVTGDKREQKFEDDYIEELFAYLSKIGVNAVTYMPSRNTRQQLLKIKALCGKYNLFEISGEDINSPRQSFICSAARAPEFANLKDATYALIGSECAARHDASLSMFSKRSVVEIPDLYKRVEYFKKLAYRQ